jgi:hypothetical protein
MATIARSLFTGQDYLDWDYSNTFNTDHRCGIRSKAVKACRGKKGDPSYTGTSIASSFFILLINA